MFFFKILILGGDSDLALTYVSKAMDVVGVDKGAYNEWYEEIKILGDICDLEINVITDMISADFDDLIQMADGIIYFFNPLNEIETEFFEIITKIIDKIRRNIPTILLYYDPSGFITISVNELLEQAWTRYKKMEAFVNLPPKEFRQVLHCISLAMISGDTPLNIENAWMKFPFYIKMANSYFKEKDYFLAAQALKKAAIISEIFNREEAFIICEQAAHAFSKANLFLEASKILENVDGRKSHDFKRQYIKAMINEGDKLNREKDYGSAADRYTRAGQWCTIESMDKDLILKSFKLAITTWISAHDIKKAFKILERLSHNDVNSILLEIEDNIMESVDILVSKNRLEPAKEQLSFALDTYQREGLFENIKKFVNKLIEILIKLLEHHVNKKESHLAKNNYDDIEKIWDTFKVNKTNLDNILKRLIIVFLDELNFSTSSVLTNKLNSLELKKELTDVSYKVEDENKKLMKKEKEEIIKQRIDIIKKFVEYEQNIVKELNNKKLNEANEYLKQKEYLKATSQIKSQADYLRNSGMFEDANEILMKALDISMERNLFDVFFKYYFEYYGSLRSKIKREYLLKIFPVLTQKFSDVIKEENYDKQAKFFENYSKIYRNEMLYDESKEISKHFVKVVKNEALRIVESQKNTSGIEKASELVKKANYISSAYLDNVKISFNKIYKKISEIYISIGNISQAQAYYDQIEKRADKIEIKALIEKYEAEQTEKVEKSLKEEILKESFLIIKKKERDLKHDRENDLRQRKGLKRTYFREALNYLTNEEFDKATESYINSIVRLNRIKKYNLAGLSLALAGFLFIKDNKIENLIRLLEIKELSSSEKIFQETYAVSLIKYIVDLVKLQNKPDLKEPLSHLQNLPLFEEELKVLLDYLGKDYQKEIVIEKTREKRGELSKIRLELDNKSAYLQQKISEQKQDSEVLFRKRKAMKRRYYEEILTLVRDKSYGEAALKFRDLAINFSRRKDFKTSAFLMLLQGLALFKENESPKDIKVKIKDFLNTMGVSKKLVEDTFDISLLFFIIDAKINNQEKFLPEIREMLSILPLFEEEKELIDINID